jgi:hypothetical protein
MKRVLIALAAALTLPTAALAQTCAWEIPGGVTYTGGAIVPAGSPAAGPAGPLPAAWTAGIPAQNGKRFVLRQPADVACEAAGCGIQAKVAAGATGQVDPSTVATAELLIDQAWKVATLSGQSGAPELVLPLYSQSFSGPSTSEESDATGVVAVVSTMSNTATLLDTVPASVCAAINAKGVTGIGCSGGVLSAHFTAVKRQVYAQNGTYRSPYDGCPFAEANQWSVPLYEDLRAALPAVVAGGRGFADFLVPLP